MSNVNAPRRVVSLLTPSTSPRNEPESPRNRNDSLPSDPELEEEEVEEEELELETEEETKEEVEEEETKESDAGLVFQRTPKRKRGGGGGGGGGSQRGDRGDRGVARNLEYADADGDADAIQVLCMHNSNLEELLKCVACGFTLSLEFVQAACRHRACKKCWSECKSKCPLCRKVDPVARPDPLCQAVLDAYPRPTMCGLKVVGKRMAMHEEKCMKCQREKLKSCMNELLAHKSALRTKERMLSECEDRVVALQGDREDLRYEMETLKDRVYEAESAMAAGQRERELLLNRVLEAENREIGREGERERGREGERERGRM